MTELDRASDVVTVQEFCDLLAVEELDTDLFRARNPFPTRHRVLYGGQVAAQALSAAHQTVAPGRAAHSLHGYFLRPGQIDRPTILRVARDRDGRSFSTRHVVAIQDGQVIFNMTVSFHVRDDGIEFDAEPTPILPPPETLALPSEAGPLGYALGVFEIRLASEERIVPGARFQPVPTRFWLRTRAPIGDDPAVHTALATYASDLSTGFGDLRWPIQPPSGGPSLDHSIWFHRPLRADEWFLLDQTPVLASGGRGLYTGAIYDVAGRRCVTIAQEVLLRSPRDG